jgi:hypothetical protein
MTTSNAIKRSAAYRASWRDRIGNGEKKIVVTTGRLAVPVATVRAFVNGHDNLDLWHTGKGEHTIVVKTNT